MLVPNLMDENVLADRSQIMDQSSKQLKPRIHESSFAWQCFPEGSISSIESLPPIEDDESGTEFHGSPALGHSSSRPGSSSPYVKLMCSFGGRILPRPSDGKLRYVGGDTRLVTVRRDFTYSEVMHTMRDKFGQELTLKYQLPNEELDALISVSTDEDLQNMMDEYDRVEGGGDAKQRLRVFLFPTHGGDGEVPVLMDPLDSKQWYVEAVNGFPETCSSSRRSDGGMSSRPSAENLVALENVDLLHGYEVEQPLLPRRMAPEVHSPAMHGYTVLEGRNLDMDHYHEQDRIMRGVYGAETSKLLPRVGSHGKLSRLQEQQQHEDVVQDFDHLVEPRSRYVLPVRQHGLEGGQYPLSEGGGGGYSHAHRKEQMYRAEQCFQQHHRHQFPNEAYEFLPQQHVQHQDDYFPGHIYQRTSSHAEGGNVGVMNSHGAQYQIGSSPNSPRLPYRDGRLHQQLPVHRAYSVEHPYVRRPFEEPGRTYRLSASPPRYRDHLLDEQRSFHPVQHHQDRAAPLFDQPEMLSRPGMAGYGPGYHDSALYYQRGGGEGRRQVHSSPHVNSRLDYQDHLVQMEQLSLHNQNQRFHDVLDWREKILEAEHPRHIWNPQQEFAEGNQSIESEMQLFLEQQTGVPLAAMHGSDSDRSSQRSKGSHLMPAQPSIVVSDNKWDVMHEGSNLTDELMDSSVMKMAGSGNRAGPVQSQQGAPDLPVFDKSGIFDSHWDATIAPASQNSRWDADSNGNFCSKAAGSGVIDLLSQDPLEEPPTESRRVSHMMSETGHLVEDMVSSVLKSGVVEQDVRSLHQKESEHGLLDDLTPVAPDTDLDLAPQPTFTVQSWDKVLVHGSDGHHETGTCLKDDNQDKLVNGSLDKPPPDVASVAELEATSRGLQTIKNSDLEEIRELGSGTYGTVFHGKWRGTDVAIKRIKASCFDGKPSERERLVADFWKEACTLSQLHHPNVVAFYGVVPDGPGGTLATVTEYMVNGSLKQVLQKKDRTIDRRKRLLIATDAAFGMEYLHGKNIVHFDLKCENLLVNMRDPHRPVCKVGDFGLSKVKRQTMVSGGVRGTLPWMAPELLSTSSSMVTERVDVFSFGIVMWELLTGEEPYANMHYGAIIGGIVSNTLRPTIPTWCDPAWRSLMERCWAADASTRPSFSEIASELRAMTSSLQPKA